MIVLRPFPPPHALLSLSHLLYFSLSLSAHLPLALMSTSTTSHAVSHLGRLLWLCLTLSRPHSLFVKGLGHISTVAKGVFRVVPAQQILK